MKTKNRSDNRNRQYLQSPSSLSYKTNMLKRHVKNIIDAVMSQSEFSNIFLIKKIHTEVFIPNQRPERCSPGLDETPSDKCEYSNDQTLQLNRV